MPRFDKPPAPVVASAASVTPEAAARRARRQAVAAGPGPESAAEMLCVLQDTTVELLKQTQAGTDLFREVLAELQLLREKTQAAIDAAEVNTERVGQAVRELPR